VGKGVDEKPGLLTAVPTSSRELLQKVAASQHFQKSRRLRDLLLYLGERALQDPGCVLHEQEIGVAVFDRQPDYDTSHDTLVRVHVSQLRKKLQDYFHTEGRAEPLIIEIPKGSYVPVFHPPSETPPESELEKRPASLEKRSAFWARPFLAGMATALALIGAGWGIFAPAKDQPNRGRGNLVDTFWSQLFGNGHATYAVLSDVTLIEFQNLMGRSIPLAEYETHEFDQLAGKYIADPTERSLAKEFVSRVTTSISDVQAARDFSLLAARNGAPLNILSARDVSSSLIASENTILLGSWRANPWVGLFEDRMAFQAEYQETPPAMRFVNRSPLAAEPATFQAEWRRYGYCRVTYMPNPNHTGNVLLITGSDVISTEAGGRYVSSEESLGQLRQKLGLKPRDAIPHFEVLLRTQVVNNTVPWFDVIAYRPHHE
jgi:hypothetical protein